MIVPQTRLIVWTGVVTLGAAFLAMANVVEPSSCILVAVIFVLAAMIDGMISGTRLKGVRAVFPDVVRLSKDRPGQFDIDVENDRLSRRRIRLGVAFPAEISSEFETLETTLPADTPLSRVSCSCTARKRGEFYLENIYIETSSRMGLWAVRTVCPAKTVVKVYPNVMGARKGLAALFLNRGTLGIHAHRQIGKGKEFERLRTYMPGDSFEDIHWKATAKRGEPITKIFQIEKTQEVYVILDASRTSARAVEEAGQPETNQLERFITAAMVLGLVAERQGDLFGLLTFSNKVDTFVRARTGKVHYGTCRDTLYTLQPKMVNPDFGELCSFIRLRLRRRALLIFLTNLDDPVLSENFMQNIDILGRHHLVLVNMVAEPDVKPLFSEPDVVAVDDIYRSLGGHIRWHRLRELQRLLKRHGVSATLMDNETLCARMVTQYMNVKKRQIL